MIISLFTIVILLQIAFFVINAVGPKTINEILWQFSARLPLAATKDAQEQLRLRREVLRLKKEMNAISAQDNFSKWAKLRREHDKLMAQHDQKATAVSAHRNSFDTKANIARWLLTTGIQTLLQFWYAKVPVFTYPQGWLPWPVEWVLGFPRCPYGAVSVNIWTMVVRTIVTTIGESLLARTQKQPTKEKVAVPVMADKKKS